MFKPWPQPPRPQPPRPQPPRHNGRQYLIGLGLGFIPVVLVSLYGAFSCPIFTYRCPGTVSQGLASFFSTAGVILYVVEIVAMIVTLANATVRFIGYGLLTMVLVGPIVGVVGCLVIGSATHA